MKCKIFPGSTFYTFFGGPLITGWFTTETLKRMIWGYHHFRKPSHVNWMFHWYQTTPRIQFYMSDIEDPTSDQLTVWLVRRHREFPPWIFMTAVFGFLESPAPPKPGPKSFQPIQIIICCNYRLIMSESSN